jgi:acetyl-CoA acetyltransferase
VLTISAILDAAADAGIDPKSIDGFVGFSNERNTATRVSNALGVHEVTWSTLQWGGGGGGGAGAVQQAVAAIHAGYSDVVCVYRGLAQGQFGRFGGARPRRAGDSLRVSYGMNTPAELFASRMTRFLHDTGVSPLTQRAVSLASYRHAATNPRAVMRSKQLTAESYDESRWIVEPWRLYDCCQESDGACALILVSAERARDLPQPPAYVLSAAMGGGHRSGGFVEGIFDPDLFATAEFTGLAKRLFGRAGLAPADVDVVQSYENFTGGVVMSLIEHGLCTIEDANEVLVEENLLAPSGRLPLNTSGGNLAEAYIHGLQLHVEGVRQLRGSSVNQVPDAQVSLVSAGPMVAPASTILYGSEATL